MPKRMVKRQIIKYPAMTAAEIQVSVSELMVVSERTIQQTPQKDVNIPCRIAAMKPLLTEKMKAKEAQVCQDISALYQGRLGQVDVFGRIRLQTPQIKQDHHQEAPGEQQI
jgi:hypothetical protein